jgi:formylglycine-generating enzyme
VESPEEPNAWGLYDMSGNAYEFCWDREDTYPSGTMANPAQDPVGETGSQQVRRGGSWGYLAEQTRAADRYRTWQGSRNMGSGFRLARSL